MNSRVFLTSIQTIVFAAFPTMAVAAAAQLHHSQPSKDIFADTFITGLSDSTVLFPWGNQICDTTERIINTHGIGKSYDKRIKILPNTAQNGSTALWARSRDGAWIVIQSNNVDGGRTCIAARGDAGTKFPNITIGRPRDAGEAPVASAAGKQTEPQGASSPPCLAEYESTMEAAVKGSMSDAEFTGKVRQALDSQRDRTRLVGSNCKESTSVLKDYGQELEKAEKEFELWRKWPDGAPLKEKRRYPVAWAKYKICLMESFNRAVCR